MPRITVSKDELKMIERKRAREKKKEEERQKLEALKNINWEVSSLEDVYKKAKADPSEEQIKEFVDEANKLISATKELFTLDAIKFHDKIYNRFIKKGWECTREPRTNVGLYAINFNHTGDLKIYATQSYDYERCYFYKIDNDRMIVYDTYNGGPEVVIKAAIKTSELRTPETKWEAHISNNSIDYNLGCLNYDELASLLKCSSKDVMYSAVLTDVLFGSLHIRTTDKLPLTKKQICSTVKQKVLTSTTQRLERLTKELEQHKGIVQMIKNANFEKFAEL